MRKKTARPAGAPDKLIGARKPSGVALTERELANAAGGFLPLKI